jgi:hypothetical protein
MVEMMSLVKEWEQRDAKTQRGMEFGVSSLMKFVS